MAIVQDKLNKEDILSTLKLVTKPNTESWFGASGGAHDFATREPLGSPQVTTRSSCKWTRGCRIRSIWDSA
jgi:hypothetical protein